MDNERLATHNAFRILVQTDIRAEALRVVAESSVEGFREWAASKLQGLDYACPPDEVNWADLHARMVAQGEDK